MSNRYCCLLASKQTTVSVWHIPDAVCTVLNSWWWTDTVVCLLPSRQQYLFDIYLMLYVQYWTPDDWRKDRPKHVECYSKIKSFFFRWRYSPLWALACRTIPLHLSLSITSSLHLLTPNTWRSLSTSSLHPFLGLPLRLVPSSSWVKIFLGILSSSILSRWPNQIILCPFIHFTIFSPSLNSSSSRFVLIFHSHLHI